MSVLSFAESEIVQARTDRTNVEEITKKTFLFYNCISTASHCNNCMRCFDKGYNRQFHCVVGKDVSFVSLQAQLKRHHSNRTVLAQLCLVGIQVMLNIAIISHSAEEC